MPSITWHIGCMCSSICYHSYSFTTSKVLASVQFVVSCLSECETCAYIALLSACFAIVVCIVTNFIHTHTHTCTAATTICRINIHIIILCIRRVRVLGRHSVHYHCYRFIANLQHQISLQFLLPFFNAHTHTKSIA